MSWCVCPSILVLGMVGYMNGSVGRRAIATRGQVERRVRHDVPPPHALHTRVIRKLECSYTGCLMIPTKPI